MANEFKHITSDRADAGAATQAEFDKITAHGFDSQATGDIPYASSASQISRLAIGSGVLGVSGGIPAWTLTPSLTSITLSSKVTTPLIDTASGDLTFSPAGNSVFTKQVQIDNISAPAAYIKRTTSAFSNIPGLVDRLIMKTTLSMLDGFGGILQLALEDTDAVVNPVSELVWERSGADNTGKIILKNYLAGVLTSFAELSDTVTDGETGLLIRRRASGAYSLERIKWVVESSLDPVSGTKKILYVS